MKKDDDINIIKQVLAGNSDAYGLLINKYKDKAYTLAWRILRNREDAEEASQDAFIKCFYALPRYKFEASFSTWLYRVVYTSSISLLRKKKNVKFTDIEPVISDYKFSTLNDALNSMKEETQKKYLIEAMKKLSEEENSIIFLFYQTEKSVEDISRITGLSKSNVKVKLFRARQKLFNQLKILLKKEVYDLL